MRSFLRVLPQKFKKFKFFFLADNGGVRNDMVMLPFCPHYCRVFGSQIGGGWWTRTKKFIDLEKKVVNSIKGNFRVEDLPRGIGKLEFFREKINL